VPDEPTDPIGELEGWLLREDQRLEASVAVRAEGAIEAELRGVLTMIPDRVELAFEGTFAGEPKTPWLVVEGDTMRGGSTRGTAAFEAPAGQARDAIVVGLVRMGILHNIARLCFDRPPDHAEGEVRSWVEAREVRETTDAAEHVLVDGAGPAPMRRLDFDVIVAGTESAEASLWIRDQLPFARAQTVHFDEGPMRVREELVWSRPTTSD
jgi:hypothetical protein